MGSFVPLVGTFAEQKQCLQPRNITKEVTAFDIHLMGSGSIFMELTSFSEFFIITVRKWLNFSAGSSGGGGGGNLQKNCFSALPASVWSKNKGETQAPPLGPPLNFVCQGVDNDGGYICWLI